MNLAGHKQVPVPVAASMKTATTQEQLNDMLSRCDDKAKKLNHITGNKYAFGFGYIGNYERWGDDTEWRLFISHDYFSSVEGSYRAEGKDKPRLEKLAKWVLSLPEREDQLIAELKLKNKDGSQVIA